MFGFCHPIGSDLIDLDPDASKFKIAATGFMGFFCSDPTIAAVDRRDKLILSLAFVSAKGGNRRLSGYSKSPTMLSKYGNTSLSLEAFIVSNMLSSMTPAILAFTSPVGEPGAAVFCIALIHVN